jgi:hypothetical protein
VLDLIKPARRLWTISWKILLKKGSKEYSYSECTIIDSSRLSERHYQMRDRDLAREVVLKKLLSARSMKHTNPLMVLMSSILARRDGIFGTKLKEPTMSRLTKSSHRLPPFWERSFHKLRTLMKCSVFSKYLQLCWLDQESEVPSRSTKSNFWLRSKRTLKSFVISFWTIKIRSIISRLC